MKAKRKTWKDRLTKRQLAHIRITTQRSTLTEVRANVERAAVLGHRCFECEDILRRVAK